MDGAAVAALAAVAEMWEKLGLEAEEKQGLVV